MNEFFKRIKEYALSHQGTERVESGGNTHVRYDVYTDVEGGVYQFTLREGLHDIRIPEDLRVQDSLIETTLSLEVKVNQAPEFFWYQEQALVPDSSLERYHRVLETLNDNWH